MGVVKRLAGRIALLLPCMAALAALFWVLGDAEPTQAAAQANAQGGYISKQALSPVLTPRLNQLIRQGEVQIAQSPYGALTVETTLWPGLQAQAEQILSRTRSARTALVVTEAYTGRVLVLAGAKAGRLDPAVALNASAPAASLFKIVTAAAAVEETPLHAQSKINFTGRPHSLYKEQVRHQVSPKGAKVTLKDSFATSNNPIFGKLGIFHLGEELLTWYGRALGFESSLPFEVNLGVSKLLRCADDFSIAEMASGYNSDTTISPLHAALLSGVFINGGRLMEPYMIQRVQDQRQRLVYQGHPRSLGRIVSPAAARQMSDMFAATITKGTARSAFAKLNEDRYLRDIYLGGKTGTISGADGKELFEWFSGFARDEHTGRTLAIASLVVHKKPNRLDNAKQTARLLLRQAFSDKQSSSTQMVSQPKGNKKY